MEDIGTLKTINFNYWLEFSSYTRRITAVVHKIRQGIQYKDEKNDVFFQIAESQKISAISPVILVGEDIDSLIILEGHFRLVALLLDESPLVIPAIIGLSKHISEWVFY